MNINLIPALVAPIGIYKVSLNTSFRYILSRLPYEDILDIVK